MSARRLLVAIDEMEVGGSQRQVTCLLGGLDRAQWQAELVYFRTSSFLVDDLRARGIVVHHVPKRGRIDLRFLFRYAALLRRGRYDVVHAFSLTAELWTLAAGLLAPPRPPMVASVRGLYLDRPASFWSLKRLVLARSAAIISNSRAGAAAAASRARLPPERFNVVPNGIRPSAPVPTSERDALRSTLGAGADGRALGLFVGRLVEQKNIPCLVVALASMPPASRPRMVLAGDGPLRAQLEAMGDAAGLGDDLRFLGERDDVASLMQAADFLVLPSSFEGMPNVLMEAMSRGCPVVASAVGGSPELVEDGVTGLLFPSDDAPALAAQLQRLASDPALRARLSAQAARRIGERHSIERLVSETTAIYAACLAAGTSPAEARAAIGGP